MLDEDNSRNTYLLLWPLVPHMVLNLTYTLPSALFVLDLIFIRLSPLKPFSIWSFYILLGDKGVSFCLLSNLLGDT